MSDFFVGQKVVCVDGSPSAVNPDAPGPWVTRGAIYTISKICALPSGNPGVNLSEFVPHPDGCSTFRVSRFRPLESKAISIFRAIAANPHIDILEDA